MKALPAKPWLAKQQQQLSQQLSAGQLPHALLITGVANSGKHSLGQWLIDVFICQSPQISENVYLPCQQCKACLLNQAGTYPDHLTLAVEKNSIGVDSIRGVSYFFEKSAQLGQVKSALIEQAELMTVSASNALLKTLEEPCADRFIILTTPKVDNLLATIISRCQRIDIRPPIGEQLLAEQLLSNVQAGDTQLKNKFTNISDMPEQLNSAMATNFVQFEQALLEYLQGGDSAVLFELLAEQAIQPEALRWLEKILCAQVRAYHGWQEANSNEKILNQAKVLAMYQQVLASKQLLVNLPQANKSMMLEKLIIDLEMIRKGAS